MAEKGSFFAGEDVKFTTGREENQEENSYRYLEIQQNLGFVKQPWSGGFHKESPHRERKMVE